MKVDLVLAPNPGPMTGPGTNTWLAAAGGEAVVIDPGPVIDTHLDAIVAALAPRAFFSISLRKSITPEAASVRIGPAETALTRIPSSPRSWAR